MRVLVPRALFPAFHSGLQAQSLPLIFNHARKLLLALQQDFEEKYRGGRIFWNFLTPAEGAARLVQRG